MPENIYRQLSRSATRQGLILSRGPDLRSSRQRAGATAKAMRSFMGLDDWRGLWICPVSTHAQLLECPAFPSELRWVMIRRKIQIFHPIKYYERRSPHNPSTVPGSRCLGVDLNMVCVQKHGISTPRLNNTYVSTVPVSCLRSDSPESSSYYCDSWF